MKKAKLTWSLDALGTFLAGSSRLVPGTELVTIVARLDERQAMVDFLAARK